MKIITEDKLTGTITSSAGTLAADYPTSNVQNNYPGRKWISDQNQARLTLDLYSSVAAAYIGTISADTLTYKFMSTGVSVTGATQANPCVITAVSHGFSDGDTVYFLDIGGMIEINDSTYLVANSTDDTFEITDSSGTDIDASAYTAYSSGGTVYQVYDDSEIYLREVRTLTEFMRGLTTIHTQGWADLTYSDSDCVLQLNFGAIYDNKSSITTWNSTSGDAVGQFTDGSDAIALDEDVKVDVGSIVFFDETTSTDVRSISRDGTTNNIKLTTLTAHGFSDGDKIYLDDIQVDGTDIEVAYKVFEVTNSTSTTVDLDGTDTTYVTTTSSSTDLGAISKLHQITQIVGDGTTADTVTLSPSPASHADISTTASVYKILYGISVGVIRAGYAKTFKNPQQGFGDNRRSFSVRKQIANGKMYQRNRNITKVSSGSLQLEDSEYLEFMDFSVDQDSDPFACLMFDDLDTTSRHAGFYTFTQLPDGTIESSSLRRINFQLTEFI